jgi:predicted Holliday junction resolvase-like endonuclease
MIGWILFVVLLFVLIVVYVRGKQQLSKKARLLFEKWKKEEAEKEISERIELLFKAWKEKEEEQIFEKAELLFEKWKKEEEKNIRKDAIDRSQAVTRGKITEHLIPFFPSFEYDPKDARFIGSPIDFIVFDGLSEGEIKNVVFVEVKAGKSASLSPRERKVRDCIQSKNVEWKILKHVDNESES